MRAKAAGFAVAVLGVLCGVVVASCLTEVRYICPPGSDVTASMRCGAACASGELSPAQCEQVRAACESGDLTSEDCAGLDGDQGMPDLGMPDQGRDLGQPDLGPCGTCTSARPICDEATGDCVACTMATEGTDCADSPTTPVCGLTGDCVACRANAQCMTATASHCVSESCTSCGSDPDCAHLSGTPRCVSGTCRACTPATEAADCAGNSCNPATNACTATMVGSRRVCQSCVSDTDCEQVGGTFRCVPMEYQEAPRGGYCLQVVPAEPDECPRPFLSLIPATSLSGAALADYCGIDESVVTCEAVNALIDGAMCPAGDVSACRAEGALCRRVGAALNRCTYACGGTDQCPLGFPCRQNYCGAPQSP